MNTIILTHLKLVAMTGMSVNTMTFLSFLLLFRLFQLCLPHNDNYLQFFSIVLTILIFINWPHGCTLSVRNALVFYLVYDTIVMYSYIAM